MRASMRRGTSSAFHFVCCDDNQAHRFPVRPGFLRAECQPEETTTLSFQHPLWCPSSGGGTRDSTIPCTVPGTARKPPRVVPGRPSWVPSCCRWWCCCPCRWRPRYKRPSHFNVASEHDDAHFWREPHSGSKRRRNQVWRWFGDSVPLTGLVLRAVALARLLMARPPTGRIVLVGSSLVLAAGWSNLQGGSVVSSAFFSTEANAGATPRGCVGMVIVSW